MVKLFLVCFAVCMGATSGNVNFGTCSNQVKNLKPLNSFSEETLTLCWLPKESNEELKNTVGHKAILKVTLVFSTFKDGITAILRVYFKDNSKPQEIPDITFTEAGVFSNLAIGNPKTGSFFNQPCRDGTVLSELCSKGSTTTGARFLTIWGDTKHACGKPEACSTSKDWVKPGA